MRDFSPQPAGLHETVGHRCSTFCLEWAEGVQVLFREKKPAFLGTVAQRHQQAP